MADQHNKIYFEAVADVTGALKGLSVLDGALLNLSRSVGSTLGGMGGIIAGALAGIGIAFGGAVKESATHAIQFEALMTNINETMGKSADKFEEWQATTGRAMGFSKEESASMAVQVSANMRMISKSQEDLMQKTTKFMEISAILKSRTAMGQEEITRRMMSAMNQEADGAMELGLDVRTCAITMSEAFKKMADGKPWAELSSSMQKAILYQYILDTVTSRYGDKVANTTALQTQILSASLKDLRLAFGQVFVPIIAKVIPAIIKLVNWLTTLFSLVARFNEGLWGHKTPKDTANVNRNTDAIKKNYDATQKLGNAIDDVRKKTKKAQEQNSGFLASFDEVHTIPKVSSIGDGIGDGTGGSGGGGIGGGGMFDDIKTSADDATNSVNSLFGKMKEIGDGLNLIGSGIRDIFHGDLTTGFEKIAMGIGKIWSALFGKAKGQLVTDGLMYMVKYMKDIKDGNYTKAFDDMALGIGKIWSALFGKSKGQLITDGLLLINSYFKNIKDGKYDTAMVNLATGLGKIWSAIFGHEKGKELTTGIIGIYNGIKNIKAGNFKTGLDDIGKGFGNIYTSIFGHKGTNLLDAVKKLYGWWKDLKNLNVAGALNNWAKGLQSLFKAIGSDTLAKGFGKIYDKVRKNWNKIITDIATWKNPVTGNYTFKGLYNYRLPELYNGGITNGKTIAQIGDNVGGREVVSPLNTLKSMIGDQMVQTLSMRGGGSGGYNTGGDIVLTVDGREFARIIKPFQQLEDKRVGTNIRTKLV